MKKRNHFFLTFVLSLWIFYFLVIFPYLNNRFYISLLLSFITANLSWLPDIDLKIIKKIEKLKKKNKIIYYLFFPFFIIIKKILTHRGVTHSIWPISILIFVDIFLIKDFIFSLLIKIIYFAILFHILEDSLTLKGIYPFYPLKLKLRVAKFNTNSSFHSFIFDLLSILLFFLFLYVTKFKIKLN